MTLQSISSALRKWREYRAHERQIHASIRELLNMTDRELIDIGISRYDIESIARQQSAH